MFRSSHTRATRRSKLIAALVVPMLWSAGAAHAKDFCIDRPGITGNPEFVLFNYALPKPGKCKPFIGVYAPETDFAATTLQGVACTPASGDRVNFTMTLGYAPDLSPGTAYGEVFFITAVLDRSDLQGRVTEMNRYGTPHLTLDATGSACNSKLFLPKP